MWFIVLIMFVVLGTAGAVLLVVMMGMEGRGKSKHPELADRFARAAQHLNGDAEPPRQIVDMLERR